MMLTLRKCVLVLVGCMAVIASYGQTEIELAELYFNNGEFEQAKLYYERIWKTNKTNQVYENYLATLVGLGELEEAEKIVKRKLKNARYNKATIYVDLGKLYLQFAEDEKAFDAFDDAVKDLEPGRSNGSRLGRAFVNINQYDYAFKTYEKARRIDTDGYGYHYEMAQLQGMMGDHQGMVESYMELLAEAPNYAQTVQNSMNRLLNIVENEENAVMVQNEVLRRVQRNPEVTIYSELLIWLYLQRKEFGGALVQAKALDKRLGENGVRIVDIAQLAANNEDYTPAKDAYNYVIAKGPSSEFYMVARTELLQTTLAEITQAPSPDVEQLRNLSATYELALDELGRSAESAIILKELAHIKGFYLGEAQSGIELLESALAIPGLNARVEALCKLELADNLILIDDIWDASLLYSQVELDFKEDPLGHEAKFRNARVSYYTGDFEWAQAQLDVLKASTSKLISNDAIDLSLLITDNFNMDTTTVAMLLFAQADLLAFQNRIPQAFFKLDSLTTTFPGHSLTDEILMMKADIHTRQGEFERAMELLQVICDVHFADILGDDAVFKLAELNHYQFGDLEQAQELYNRLLLDFPGSLYAVEARKRFRALRGDSLGG